MDEYAVRREPKIYKVDLTDAISKSIVVTKLILVMTSKQHAHKHMEYKSEFAGEPSRGPIAFYACKANRAVARAALMFQQHPPGCSTRAITWFCPNMSYAYIGALKQAMLTGDDRLRDEYGGGNREALCVYRGRVQGGVLQGSRDWQVRQGN